MARHEMALLGALAMLTAGVGIGHAQTSSSQPPAPPKAVSEVPAMGGQPNTKSGAKVIGLRANEVALSRLANTNLTQKTTETLGQEGGVAYQSTRNQVADIPHKIGTVTTELLDPAKKEVTFVGIKGDSDKVTALPWSQVQAIHQPNDELTTAMTPQAIAAAPTLSQKASGNAVDVSQNLIGREVTAADGSKLGTVSDVVVEMKSGKLDYAVVDPGGVQLGTSNAPHAVPWNDVKSVAGDKSQPVTSSLNSQQLAALPVFGGSKAEETEAGRAAAAKGGATPQPAP